MICGECNLNEVSCKTGRMFLPVRGVECWKGRCVDEGAWNVRENEKSENILWVLGSNIVARWGGGKTPVALINPSPENPLPSLPPEDHCASCIYNYTRGLNRPRSLEHVYKTLRHDINRKTLLPHHLLF